jgi:hypothetical protein
MQMALPTYPYSGRWFNLRIVGADLKRSQITEPLNVMSSQLGRMILNASASTEDEMSARPDPDGSYGPLDAILEEIAAQRLNESQVLKRSTAGTQIAI